MKKNSILTYALIIPSFFIVGKFTNAQNAQIPVSEPINLVENGDFETFAKGVFPNWTYDVKGVLLDKSPSAIAKNSARFTGITVKRYLTSDEIMVKSGATYKLQFTCRIQGSAGPNPGIEPAHEGELKASILNGANNKRTSFKPLISTSPSNETLSGIYTVPAGQTSIKIIFYKNADIAYLDDVSLIEQSN